MATVPAAVPVSAAADRVAPLTAELRAGLPAARADGPTPQPS